MTTAMRHKAAPRTRVDWFLTFLRFLLTALVGFGLLAFVLQQIDPGNPLADAINPDANRLSWDAFQGLVVSGLSQGSMYGLIALGYSMVYGVLGFINFAHGEVFMVGAFTGFIMSNKFDEAGLWEGGAFIPMVLITVIVATLVSMITAIIMERIALPVLVRSTNHHRPHIDRAAITITISLTTSMPKIRSLIQSGLRG